MHRLSSALLSLFSVLALAASLPDANPSQATKDPQAVAILTQCLTAVGGATAIGNIQDFTRTGMITYDWAGQNVTGYLGREECIWERQISRCLLSWAWA